MCTTPKPDWLFPLPGWGIPEAAIKRNVGAYTSCIQTHIYLFLVNILYSHIYLDGVQKCAKWKDPLKVWNCILYYLRFIYMGKKCPPAGSWVKYSADT